MYAARIGEVKDPTMRFYEEMIRRIAADANPAVVIEEIRIYRAVINRLDKGGRP